MNIAKKIAVSTKKFVSNHKTGVAFVAGATIGLVANKLALRDHDNFLRDHGLYDEYYLPQE